jgi:hypothetical protein
MEHKNKEKNFNFQLETWQKCLQLVFFEQMLYENFIEHHAIWEIARYRAAMLYWFYSKTYNKSFWN